MVKLYASADCSGSPVTTDGASSFATGFSETATSDATTTYSANASDAAGNTSECSDPVGFVNDSTTPDAPSSLSASPDSPSQSTDVTIRGTAEAGSSVDLYDNATCSGSPIETDDAAAFAAGIAVTADSNAATSWTATTTDAAGNSSECSDPVSFTNDTIAPDAPNSLSISPPSPSQSTSASVAGVAESGSSVKLYASSTCTGSPVETGSASSFASGFAVTTPSNASTSYAATATDAAGNTSDCSDSVSFTHDSTPPPAPSALAVDQKSPSTSTALKVSGQAEAESTVRLYDNSSCAGTQLASGSAADFAVGFAVTAQQNASTSFAATATDAAGNTSACSDPVSFVNDTTAPATPPAPSSNVTSPSTSATLKLSGNVAAGSTVKVYATKDCSGEPIAVATDAEYAAGIDVLATKTDNVYSVAVFDASGNASACSAPIPYTVLQNTILSHPKLKAKKHRGYTRFTGSVGLSGPTVDSSNCIGTLVATFIRTKNGKAYPDAKRGTIRRPAAVLRWSGASCTAKVHLSLGKRYTPEGVTVKSYLVLTSPKLVAPAASFKTKF
jgi:hypothetical protein